jgi:hypothetical protein
MRLLQIIAAMALLGSVLKWNMESVPRLEQSVRGYIKNFYNKKTGVPPTRGWMLKDRQAFVLYGNLKGQCYKIFDFWFFS